MCRPWGLREKDSCWGELGEREPVIFRRLINFLGPWGWRLEGEREGGEGGERLITEWELKYEGELSYSDLYGLLLLATNMIIQQQLKKSQIHFHSWETICITVCISNLSKIIKVL